MQIDRLPRMADFALWATASESALWPTGKFARSYAANRRAAVENAIDADPVAACVRQELMIERGAWTGSATDMLRAEADFAAAGFSRSRPGWPTNPRALAGRLRRAQTALRTLGIEIAFSREGSAGRRVIRMSTDSKIASAATAGPQKIGLERSHDVSRTTYRARPGSRRC